jgi:hypothetical protein
MDGSVLSTGRDPAGESAKKNEATPKSGIFHGLAIVICRSSQEQTKVARSA